jgi:hypothetical protein
MPTRRHALRIVAGPAMVGEIPSVASNGKVASGTSVWPMAHVLKGKPAGQVTLWLAFGVAALETGRNHCENSTVFHISTANATACLILAKASAGTVPSLRWKRGGGSEAIPWMSRPTAPSEMATGQRSLRVPTATILRRQRNVDDQGPRCIGIITGEDDDRAGLAGQPGSASQTSPGFWFIEHVQDLLLRLAGPQ